MKRNEDDLDYVNDSREAVMFSHIRFSRYVIYLFLLLLAFALGWAYYAKIDEVTVATGHVIPTAEIKVIQSLEGGIIEKIYVQEGDHVQKGQPLLQIDKTRFTAEYNQFYVKYVALTIAHYRLMAEANGKSTLHIPTNLEKLYPNVVRRERELFNTNQRLLRKKLEALENNLRLEQREYTIIESVVKERLVSELEVIRMKKSISKLKGDIENTKNEFRQKSTAQLTDNQNTLDALKERLITLKDRMVRTTIRSPINGHVSNLIVSTVGGVVKPSMKMMEIVPQSSELLIEARVRPADIAFLKTGQKAVVKFSAYDFSIYGGLHAIVTHISPTTLTDKENKTYYKIKLKTKNSFVSKHQKSLKIIPGMTVTVDIITGKKSVLDYLLKPLLKAKQSALRER